MVSTVTTVDLPQRGTYTNNYHSNSLKAPIGIHSLRYIPINQETFSTQVTLTKNQTIQMELASKNELGGVIKSFRPKHDQITFLHMGVEENFKVPDTTKHLPSQARSLIFPSVLIAYGAGNFFLKPVRTLDMNIYDNVREKAPNFNHHPENFFRYAPVALVYGLNLAGVEGKNAFIDRTVILVMAGGMMNLSIFGLKKVTNRLRPDGSNYNSFPSGHTAIAFLGAEFMAQEFGDRSIGYSAVGYGFAVATGILRIYNRNHWFSDVVAGAGFGILSVKAAYLLYPYVKTRLFKSDPQREINRKNGGLRKAFRSSSILMPTYQNGVPGLQFVMQF